MIEKRHTLLHYLIVTVAYWIFTLSDGALRMLVLLHFHELGYSPFELALLFLLYEFFGIITNLFGGFIGSRLGLRFTLILGLSLQTIALFSLAQMSPAWSISLQITFVFLVQGLSGIAKDFTKISAKSALKFLVPNDQPGRLFKWVAILTGSKNALKGIGFFLGGFLLTQIGLNPSLLGMAIVLAVAAISTFAALPKDFGKRGVKTPLSQIFSKSRAINLLSFARFFLFGARDMWFVVALPVFLYETLEWSFVQVGSYMAIWIIGYGIIQALVPRIFSNSGKSQRTDLGRLKLWGFLLVFIPVLIELSPRILPILPLEYTLVIGLGIFGVIFAFNSTFHSYLILAFSTKDNSTLNVGFYYMANAGGRLVGTLGSGLVYQEWGIRGCLWASALMLLGACTLSWALTIENE